MDKGGIYGLVRPDPIPNSEVKLARADDSPTHVGAKVGSCPFMLNLSYKGEVFLLPETVFKDILWYMLFTIFLVFMLVFAFIMLFIITSAFFGFLMTRVPFVPTYTSDIEFIVKRLSIQPTQVFYDLGSGDGKVCFLVNKLSGARCVGFEITLWTYLLAQIKLRIKYQKSKLIFKRKNFFKEDWSEADFVYGYLYPPLMGRVEAKFQKECKAGAIAIIRDFPFPNLKPKEVIHRPKEHEIYIYEK